MLKDAALRTIGEHGLINEGETVLVAISGGSDSTALLHLLKGLEKKLGIRICAAHLNHTLRGRSSDMDEKHVISFCRRIGVPLQTGRIDVKGSAKREGSSLEDSARTLRYAFLDEAAKKFGAAKIAVGHNLDDNVETFLMRLAMGTGTKGLLGIPVRRGRIIRPLIEAGKRDILAYCRRHGLRPRTDRSNFDTRFIRNRIRHKVLPVLRSINPKFEAGMEQLMHILSADHEYMMSISEKALSGAVIGAEEGRVKLDPDKLSMYPEAVQRHVLRLAIERAKGDLENISFANIEDIASRMASEGSWSLDLPGGTLVRGTSGALEFIAEKARRREPHPFSYTLRTPGSVSINEIGLCLRAEITGVPKRLKSRNRNIAMLDLSKTGRVLKVRSRKLGDRFSPFGLGGMKKLKEFLINEKVFHEAKECVPIVESRGRITWVVGHRIDDRFKITGRTRKVLKLSVSRT